jgi:hypothetical protein
MDLPGGIILAFAGFVLFAGRDWMPHHRFLAPVLPLMAPFPVQALDSFGGPKPAPALRTVAVLAMAVAVGMSLTVYRPLPVEFGRYTDGQIQAGMQINERTPRLRRE